MDSHQWILCNRHRRQRSGTTAVTVNADATIAAAYVDDGDVKNLDDAVEIRLAFENSGILISPKPGVKLIKGADGQTFNLSLVEEFGWHFISWTADSSATVSFTSAQSMETRATVNLSHNPPRVIIWGTLCARSNGSVFEIAAAETLGLEMGFGSKPTINAIDAKNKKYSVKTFLKPKKGEALASEPCQFAGNPLLVDAARLKTAISAGDPESILAMVAESLPKGYATLNMSVAGKAADGKTNVKNAVYAHAIPVMPPVITSIVRGPSGGAAVVHGLAFGVKAPKAYWLLQTTSKKGVVTQKFVACKVQKPAGSYTYPDGKTAYGLAMDPVTGESEVLVTPPKVKESSGQVLLPWIVISTPIGADAASVK